MDLETGGKWTNLQDVSMKSFISRESDGRHLRRLRMSVKYGSLSVFSRLFICQQFKSARSGFAVIASPSPAAISTK